MNKIFAFLGLLPGNIICAFFKLYWKLIIISILLFLTITIIISCMIFPQNHTFSFYLSAYIDKWSGFSVALGTSLLAIATALSISFSSLRLNEEKKFRLVIEIQDWATDSLAKLSLISKPIITTAEQDVNFKESWKNNIAMISAKGFKALSNAKLVGPLLDKRLREFLPSLDEIIKKEYSPEIKEELKKSLIEIIKDATKYRT